MAARAGGRRDRRLGGFPSRDERRASSPPRRAPSRGRGRAAWRAAGDPWRWRCPAAGRLGGGRSPWGAPSRRTRPCCARARSGAAGGARRRPSRPACGRTGATSRPGRRVPSGRTGAQTARWCRSRARSGGVEKRGRLAGVRVEGGGGGGGARGDGLGAVGEDGAGRRTGWGRGRAAAGPPGPPRPRASQRVSCARGRRNNRGRQRPKRRGEHERRSLGACWPSRGWASFFLSLSRNRPACAVVQRPSARLPLRAAPPKWL